MNIKFIKIVITVKTPHSMQVGFMDFYGGLRSGWLKEGSDARYQFKERIGAWSGSFRKSFH